MKTLRFALTFLLLALGMGLHANAMAQASQFRARLSEVPVAIEPGQEKYTMKPPEVG